MEPQVVVRLLPDKTGRVRIHWFCRHPDGAVATAEAVAGTYERFPVGHPHLPGAKGYIACQQTKTSVEPELKNGVWHPCPHTDDVRSATCPECLATPEAQAMLKTLEEIVPIPAK